MGLEWKRDSDWHSVKLWAYCSQKKKKELAIQLNSLESICKQERKQRVSGPKYRLLKSGVCADRKLRINSPSLAKAANIGAITNYLDALVLVCVRVFAPCLLKTRITVQP